MAVWIEKPEKIVQVLNFFNESFIIDPKLEIVDEVVLHASDDSDGNINYQSIAKYRNNEVILLLCCSNKNFEHY